jgi:hypothetical protein
MKQLHTHGRPSTEGTSEQGNEENIWAEQNGNNWIMRNFTIHIVQKNHKRF